MTNEDAEEEFRMYAEEERLKREIEVMTNTIESEEIDQSAKCLAYYERGKAYRELGEMERAAEDFKLFLLTDARQAMVGTTPWGFLHGALEAGKIGWQQEEAQSFLREQTFRNVLSTYDLPPDYTNKKLYSKWSIGGGINDKMRKENPQEVTYRTGVIHLLQKKLEEAIKQFDEAIEMNPEDARAYFFRGIVHALQSSEHGRSTELSKTKAISDFERAITLSKDEALTEQARRRLRATVNGVSHQRSTPWF